MWLHRRRDKEDGPKNGSENISPPEETTSTPSTQRKEEKKPSSIRRRILQFGGFGHHQQSEGQEKLSNSDLKKQLEQTKQFLFKQSSPSNNKSKCVRESLKNSRRSTKSLSVNVYAEIQWTLVTVRRENQNI